TRGGRGETPPTYSEILEYFRESKVEEFTLDDRDLQMKLTDGSEISYQVPYLSLFIDDITEIMNEKRAAGEEIPASYDLIAAEEASWFVTFLPYIVMFGIIILLWFFMMRQANGGGKAMNFGKAHARVNVGSKNKVTFADVAGADEEKEELSEIVDFLKDPKKYTDLGARVPRGVLLVGPPGTGKTYLAKAVAGEAGVPFLSISGSDFVEMYVGVGASRVRDLFDQAKKNQPAIVFIDEIDAVGRQRGAGLGGGHDEREQTLNQLLVEMDGFTVNEGVIIIAATNRPDILDSALLRPGRFDRQVYIGLPDKKARKAMLEIHARGKTFDKDVDFDVVAKATTGFSPAELENLLNEAALLTARRKKTSIGMAEVNESVVKVMMGPEKKSRTITEKDKKLTAYHEAGHAVVRRFLPHLSPVHEISIIPRGMAGGYTMWLPSDDKSYVSKNEMFESIVCSLGGRVAEKLFLDDISTGASSDISHATDTARKMVMKYGMSDSLGPIAFDSENQEVFIGRSFGAVHNYSEEIAAKIDREITDMVKSAFAKAEEIISEKADKVHAVSIYLMEHEKIGASEFNSFFAEGEGTPAIDSLEEEVSPESKPAEDSPVMGEETSEN
ncbi:MAG: ATP-dependent zinc metalloprotease FtsH, partial [Oscillospiraceae bacterium]|nr:ATP-dependent zinc metalloprotease FtsH [Oscillospiraceae bacterium]